MNEKLGFDIIQILLRANTVEELDEAIRIVNCSYPKLREHLELMDEIQGYEKLGLHVGLVGIK